VGEVIGAIVLVLVLIVVGGVFAGAEIALVSLREGQVRAMAERGRRGLRVVHLTSNPNRFLSAVQIGVTLAGFLSAAFGEAALASHLRPVLQDWGAPGGLANVVSIIVITIIISYVALVVGELAPKRLALQRAERVAWTMAPFLDRLASLSRPVIWLLSVSTNVVVRLLGGDPQASREQISEEELRDLVAGHESLGRDERKLIDDVFASGDRQLREVMVPRTEVSFLDASLPLTKAVRLVTDAPYSRFPVVRGSHDDVVGFVHVRDVLSLPAKQRSSVKVGDLAREVAMLPGSKRVLAAMSELRRGGHHMAVVVDEYGGTAGIVTLEDLIEEVVGEIYDEYDAASAAPRRLVGGEVEVDGLLNLEDFAEETGVLLDEGPYETVGGFVMARLGHLPRPGEAVEADGARVTVVALDGRRISRVRVSAPARSDG
jgi:putative hemolysin